MPTYGGAPYAGAPYGAGFIAPEIFQGVLFNTVKDPAGVPVAGALVEVKLMPTAGFRDSAPDGNPEVARQVSTVTLANGYWELPIVANAEILPAGTYYQVAEYIPDVDGGKRFWHVRVVAGTAQSVYASKVDITS